MGLLWNTELSSVCHWDLVTIKYKHLYKQYAQEMYESAVWICNLSISRGKSQTLPYHFCTINLLVSTLLNNTRTRKAFNKAHTPLKWTSGQACPFVRSSGWSTACPFVRSSYSNCPQDRSSYSKLYSLSARSFLLQQVVQLVCKIALVEFHYNRTVYKSCLIYYIGLLDRILNAQHVHSLKNHRCCKCLKQSLEIVHKSAGA